MLIFAPDLYTREKVGKFSLYKISLRGISDGTHTYEYKLDNQFFKLISDADSDLTKGSVDVNVTLKRKSNVFDLDFVLKGIAYVPCDRCLDDMSVEVDSTNRLIVKFGQEYSEESDEIVVIPEEDGEINIAWFLYEFVALSIPMKHVHAPGKCNKVMSTKLNKHRATSASDDEDSDDSTDLVEDEDIQSDDNSGGEDSRWDALKNLNFED